MSLQFDAAVVALRQGGQSRGADPHLDRRLTDVQQLFSRELAEIERVLAEMCTDGPAPATLAGMHLIGQGGKRVRPLCLLLAARCFAGSVNSGAAPSELLEMAAVVELVHSATLLHDDVVDEGLVRRGAPTAHRIHGNGVSVLSGDLLLVNALERTSRVAPALLGDLIATLRRLVDGEIIQLRGRTELDTSEATYYRVLSDKTASLFSFAARAGARMAGATEAAELALGGFGEHLGTAFQLVDDAIDYAGESTGKSLHADLMEGKLTLPLVLGIERDPGLVGLVSRIHQGDAAPVSEVAARVLASGACDETRRRAHEQTTRAIACLERVPKSASRQLLEIVAGELTRRFA